MTTILVTGVAGFIGSNLADRLISEKKYRVIGIDSLAYGIKEQIPAGVEFHKVDIRDFSIYGLFEGVDYVYHLAAKNSIIDCQNDPVDTADVNVRGTVNVFEAVRRAGVKKIIYAESSALYEGSSLLPTPETEVHPESFYAVSKFSTMYFAEAYAKFYGMKSTALRYFCVYGPRQDYRRTIPPLFSAFIIKLLRGQQPTIFGTGEKRRDFIHVDDINDFHLQCMTDDRTNGRVFNLGSGTNYSVNEIYALISSLLGTHVDPLHKPDLPGEAFANLADISSAQKIGWRPRVSLEKGIQTSIAYLRAEIAKGKVA
ncbi:MAG: NAD-dependent epimerase/dehydratase family protein [Bacteroidota bacterium]